MTHRMRITGFHLALIAMLFRALLPAGWMPNLSGTPGILIVLCSVDGPVPVVLGPDGQPVKHSPAQDDAHHDVCPFAAAPHVATPVTFAVTLPVSDFTTSVLLGPKRQGQPSAGKADA